MYNQRFNRFIAGLCSIVLSFTSYIPAQASDYYNAQITDNITSGTANNTTSGIINDITSEKANNITSGTADNTTSKKADNINSSSPNNSHAVSAPISSNYTIEEEPTTPSEKESANPSNAEIDAMAESTVSNIVVPENDSLTQSSSENSINKIPELKFTNQTLTQTINQYTITASGNMPVGAILAVSEITNTDALETVIGERRYEIYAAFDIEILIDGEVWQPIDYGETITITASNIDTPEKTDLKVYRIEEETLSDIMCAPEDVDVEDIVELEPTEKSNGDIIVETEHFTVYTFGGVSVGSADNTDTAAYLKTGKEVNAIFKQFVDSTADYTTQDNNIKTIVWTNTDLSSDPDAVNIATDDGEPVYAKGLSGRVPMGVTKYSHTANISDDGNQTGTYANNLSDKDVITIPGAASLHVTLKYGTENNYDYLYVFQGEYTGSVGGNMNAKQLAKYQGNSNSPTTVEFDIEGDTATFAFSSDGSQTYYGYYAIIEGYEYSNDINGIQLYSAANDIYLNQDSSNLFSDFNALNTIAILSELFPTLVTNYDAMFKNSASLSTLDLSNWDVSSGASFTNMFYNCTSLKKIKSPKTTNDINIVLPDINSANWYLDQNEDLVPDIKTPCLNIDSNLNNSSQIYTRDDIVGFSLYTAARLKTGKLVNAAIKSLNSYGSTYTTTNSKIKHITLSNTAITGTNISESGLPCYIKYDSSTATVYLYTEAEKIYLNADSSYMFSNFAALIDNDLPASDKLITSVATDMSYMFYNDTVLADLGTTSDGAIGVWNWDVSNTTNFSHMFDNCGQLTVNVASWNTSNMTDASYMFNNCATLISLDLNSWNTSNLTNISYMLHGCTSLADISISAWDVSDITNFSYFLDGCTSLTSLDLSDWELISDANYTNAFYAENVNTILAPKTISDTLEVPLPYKNWNLDEDNDNTPDDDIRYNNFKTSSNHSYRYIPVIWTETTLLPGEELNAIFKQFFSPSASATSVDKKITAIKWSDEAFNGSMPGVKRLEIKHEGAPVYAKLSGTEILIFTNATAIYLNQDSSNTLAAMGALLDASFFENERIHTERVVDFRGFFSSTYHYLIPTPFYQDTAANKIQSLNLSSWNVSSCQNFSHMFYYCTSLANLDISSWDVSSGTDFSYMFSSSKLTNLDISSWDVSSGTDFSNMFYYCTSLTNLDLSTWDVSSSTAFNHMFYGCSKFTSLDLSTWDVSSSTDFSGMFRDCSKLTNLDISSWDVSSGTNFSYMFYGCEVLGVYLDLSAWNVSSGTNFSYMFYDCYKIYPYVSTWDVSSGTDFSYMFHNCRNFGVFKIPRWDVSSGQNFSEMFDGCSSLTTLDISGFNTSNATSMYGMFSSCSKLASLDISNFDTSNVTNMGFMFSHCSSLTTLNISGFNTSNVTSMHGMFAYCSKLISLDVSGFSTANVTDMSGMFYSCSSLTTLDVSHFDTSNVTKMGGTYINNGMFSGCSSLVTLDVSNFNTSNVTDMGLMFYDCSKLAALDVSGFNTLNVTNMDSMFSQCSSLTTLDVSHFDTSKVKNMEKMFYNCASLALLNASTWETGLCKNFDSMFDGCTNLSDLNLQNWTISNATAVTFILFCDSLVSFSAPKTIDENTVISLPAGTWAIDNDHDHQSDDTKSYGIVINTTNHSNIYVRLNNSELISSDTTATLKYGPDFVEILTRKASTSISNIVWTDEDLSQDSSSFQIQEAGAPVFARYNQSTRILECYTQAKTVYFNKDSSKMFYDISIDELDFSKDERINFSKCENMSQMFACYFYSCSRVKAKLSALEYWDVSSVQDFSYMFCPNPGDIGGNHQYSSYPNLSFVQAWNVSSGIKFQGMFCECDNITSLDLSSWDVSSGQNFSRMFDGCKSLTTLDVSTWDVSSGTDFNCMFSSCKSLTTLDVSTWDVSSSTNFSFMFSICSSLTTLDLSTWNTSAVTTTCMLEGDTTLLQIKAPHTIQYSCALPGSNWFLDDNHDGVPDDSTTYSWLKNATDHSYTYIKNAVNQVNFIIINGTEMPSSQVFAASNTTATITDAVPIRHGYRLLRWYTDETCTQQYDLNTPVTSSFTLYAKWEQQHYTISFDANGGTFTSADDPIIRDYGTTYGALPAVIKDGEYFAGWFTPAGQRITKRDTVLLSDDTTLTARWSSEEVKFKVTFESNGGTEIAPLSVDMGASIVQPAASRAGYKLTGWYTDKTCTKPWDFATDTVESNTKLYALWELDNYYYIAVPALLDMTDISYISDNGIELLPANATTNTRVKRGTFEITGKTARAVNFSVAAPIFTNGTTTVPSNVYDNSIFATAETNASNGKYLIDTQNAEITGRIEAFDTTNSDPIIHPFLLTADFPETGTYAGTMTFTFGFASE